MLKVIGWIGLAMAAVPTMLGAGVPSTMVAGQVSPAAGHHGASCSQERCSAIGFWAGETRMVNGKDVDAPTHYWAPRDLSIYTPKLWRTLAAHRVPLYLSLNYKRDFGPVPAGEHRATDGLDLIRSAQRYGVPVKAWLLVPYQDGYWAGAANAAEEFAAIRAFEAWDHAKRLGIDEVVVDSEPPIQEVGALNAAVSNPVGLVALARENIDPARQCSSTAVYTRAISWGRTHGLDVSVTPLFLAVDEVNDGAIALQGALGVDSFPPRTWSTSYLQVYRSTISSIFGVDPGPGLAASYFESMRQDFGRNGQVSLGIAGDGPYANLSTLVQDVRVLATLGAHAIPIYSLETAVAKYGISSIPALVRASAEPYTGLAAVTMTLPGPAALAVRAAFQSLNVAATVVTPAIAYAKTGHLYAPASPLTACPIVSPGP